MAHAAAGRKWVWYSFEASAGKPDEAEAHSENTLAQEREDAPNAEAAGAARSSSRAEDFGSGAVETEEGRIKFYPPVLGVTTLFALSPAGSPSPLKRITTLPTVAEAFVQLSPDTDIPEALLEADKTQLDQIRLMHELRDSSQSLSQLEPAQSALLGLDRAKLMTDREYQARFVATELAEETESGALVPKHSTDQWFQDNYCTTDVIEDEWGWVENPDFGLPPLAPERQTVDVCMVNKTGGGSQILYDRQALLGHLYVYRGAARIQLAHARWDWEGKTWWFDQADWVEQGELGSVGMYWPDGPSWFTAETPGLQCSFETAMV